MVNSITERSNTRKLLSVFAFLLLVLSGFTARAQQPATKEKDIVRSGLPEQPFSGGGFLLRRSFFAPRWDGPRRLFKGVNERIRLDSNVPDNPQAAQTSGYR